MSDQSVYKIEALRGSENYVTWVVKMKDILADLELLEHVTEPKGGKKDTLTADEVTAWTKKDRKALVHIRVRVHETLIAEISSATTALEAWDKLKKAYGSGGFSTIIQKRKTLFRAELAEGEDAVEHIRKLRAIAADLALLGEAINDVDLALVIMTSLPPSYNSLIGSFDY